MQSKHESTILLIIKYVPPLFIISLSIIVSLSFFLNKQKLYNEEKFEVENLYVNSNKELIQSQVERVYDYIILQQKQTESKLKENLKHRVIEAYNIAMNIYNQNKHLEKDILKKLIIDAIRPITFNNNRGYFFIYTMDGINILNAGFPSIEGKNFLEYQDAKGVFLIKEMKEILKQKNETFYDWYWNKPKEPKEKHFKKTGFFKKIEPLNLFIGTGEYVTDFENDIKKDVLNYIKNLKYPNNGYIFVLNYDGVYLNHFRKEIIGLNALEVKDTRTYQTIIDALNIAKNTNGDFLSYVQNRKPGSNLPIKKISYIKGLNNWQWVIGKGFYEDDINQILEEKKNKLDKRLEDNLNTLFTISFILTLILLIISFYISNILQNIFKEYQKEIKSNLKKLTKQHNILAQQSKMAAIGEMIANIAHQWRQPLSNISTAASGLKLKKEIGSLSNEDLDKSLDYITNSTLYLSKTIDDFRNFFAKDQEQKVFLIQEAFDETLNIIKSQFKNKDINIIQNISETKILGLKSELIQVLINILNNSRDELIKKERENKLILINTFEKDEKLIITIKDNAGGIKEKDIQRVFEPYFTTKHQSQGTGIGLYMSEEIIVKHFKGFVEIENCEFEYNKKLQKGAKVTIILDIFKEI